VPVPILTISSELNNNSVFSIVNELLTSLIAYDNIPAVVNAKFPLTTLTFSFVNTFVFNSPLNTPSIA